MHITSLLRYTIATLSWVWLSCYVTLAAERTDALADERTDSATAERTDALTADDTIAVSLCIADPSDVLYSCVGHAFFRVQTPTEDVCYSYEGEYVRHQVMAFLRGRLHMGMVCQPTSEMLSLYLDEQRGVRQYRMHLTPDMAMQLRRLLERKVGEGMQLPYDYFHRGCAVSCMRLIREAAASSHQELSVNEWPSHFVESRRELVRDNLSDAPWNRFFLYNIVGSESDAPCDQWEKVVIPRDLVWVLQHASLTVQDSLFFSDASSSTCIIADDGEQLTASAPLVERSSTLVTPLFIAACLFVLQLLALFFVPRSEPSISGLRSESSISVPRSQMSPFQFYASAVARFAVLFADSALLALLFLLGALQVYLISFSSLPCTQWSWLVVVFNPLPVLFWRWRNVGVLLPLCRWLNKRVPFPRFRRPLCLRHLYALVCVVWSVVMFLLPHQIVDETHVLLSFSLALLFCRAA